MFKDFNSCITLLKKYGLGIVMVAYFLVQHYNLTQERDSMVKAYQDTVKEVVAVMVNVDNKLKSVEQMREEVKELRYEQRRLTDILQLPSKRYKDE